MPRMKCRNCGRISVIYDYGKCKACCYEAWKDGSSESYESPAPTQAELDRAKRELMEWTS